MADRNIIIEDDKGNRYFPYTKVELVQGAETPSGAQAKANTAEANAKSYTDQQVATKADVGHKHSAADITSGTIAAARLPTASTSTPGIVQLTTSRTSSSNTLALAASAMNVHRTSSDHDNRYYTKSEVDALLGGNVAPTPWASPSSNWLITHTEPVSARGTLAFYVPIPGIYRFQLTAKAEEVWSDFISDGGGYLTLGGKLYVSDSRALRISNEVSVHSLTPSDFTITLTKPCGVGWVFIMFDPATEQVDHWEDPGEYGYETLSGNVTITQIRMGGDISYLSASDVLSKFDIAT